MDKLNSIVKKIFKVSDADINDAMSAETIPNWDSMSYLMFISELEKAFAISFGVDEVLNAKNLGDIKNYLRRNGAAL